MMFLPGERPYPIATKCPKCGTVAAEWICHLCKTVKHDPDAAVGKASLLIALIVVPMMIGGFL
jgi:hypothetical protein